MAEMTSKERIRAAFAHKDTDRVPTNMMCTDSQWERLRNHYDMATNEEVLQYFECDVRYMYFPPYTGPELPPMTYNSDTRTIDIPLDWAPGLISHNVWDGKEYNVTYIGEPYGKLKTLEEVEAYEGWVNPDNYDYQAVADFVKLHEDKAIEIGLFGPWQVFSIIYGTEQALLDMYEEPEVLKAIADRYINGWYGVYERMFEAADGKIDILCCHDDYGSQKGLMFGPNLFEEFYAENTKKLCDLAHKYDAFYMQHSCGSVRKLIPNLIECGIDALEPLQKVEGMELAQLKAEFGDRIVLQGGVDTQDLIPHGTPEEVYEGTTEVIRTLYRDGGYILCGSQDFQLDAPPENIKALYDAAKQFLK